MTTESQSNGRDLLRFLTCGSVDDGKSTLIGRLLYDTGAVFDDQLASAKQLSGGELDYALLIDGLAAEREQKITIDVAYRYFATAKRQFIIADTPGHEQYTRNMATGAAGCDLAVILVDAHKGVRDQTRRHASIASLLGVRHLVVAVNKMDLVDYSQETYEKIRRDVSDFATRLDVSDLHFIPLVARDGDNVTRPSEHMPWYDGGSLLHYLESVHIASDRNFVDLRFPVQLVLRPDEAFRGYAGTVASGVLRKGAEVLALPSGRRTRIAKLIDFDGELEEAFPPQPVTITLEDELDLARGDILVSPDNVPAISHTLEAMVVWMSTKPLAAGGELLLQQATTLTPVEVTTLRYRIDVTSLHRQAAEQLVCNDIGRLQLTCARPLPHDPYKRNRSTGAFLLIDRGTNATVGAGTLLAQETADEVLSRPTAPDAGSNVRPAEASAVAPAARARRLGQQPYTVWLTGLPRSGKTTLARALEEELFSAGKVVQVLDGEALRRGLSSDLGFSARDRQEHVRRTAELARLLNDQGLIVIAALVSPLTRDRDTARKVIGDDRFLEVWCDAPLEVCEERDTAGLFARARTGELVGVTGIDAPYESPGDPALALPTHEVSIEDGVRQLVELLASRDRVED